MKKLNVFFVSTWPEVTDGISTFCENLLFNLPKTYKNYKVNPKVIRVKRFKQIRNLYKSKVVLDIKYDLREDYIRAAKYINNSECDLVAIQFINGIYGGNGGEYILDLIDNLNKPCAVILHSVAMHKVQKQKKLKQRILKSLAQRDLSVVCMSNIANNFLIKEIGFRKNNITRIYHGAPKFPHLSEAQIISEKKKYGFEKDDFIVYTYGVIREDKGILEIVKAISKLSGMNNKLKLLITGDDPDPQKSFAKKLKKLIQDESISKDVVYIDKFMPQDEIGKCLQFSDLFITAQKNLGLHSSGTLSYALSAGSAILSTGTYHAMELLPDKISIIEPTVSSISSHISKLVHDKSTITKLKKQNQKIGQKIIWPSIAKEYMKLFYKIHKDKNE